MFADRLKKSLLQAAIQGQLTEQLPTDGDARDFLRKIRAEKTKLIADKKIKAEKPLPPVTDDEIPFDIPDSWCWVRLGEIVSVLSDGIHGTPKYDSNGEFSFINGNNLSNGKIFIKQDTKRVNQTEYDKYKKNLNETTVFVSINGTLGNIAFYNNEKIILGKSACYFNLLGNISKIFIRYLLSTKFFLSYVNDKATGTTIKNVSLQAMKNFLVPLPSLAEQEQIVEKLDALLSEVDELAKDERELVELEETFPRRMRNSLLQAAIQGKLTEQLPSDGDARDLLRKIRTEKAKLLAEKKIKAEKPLPPVTDDEILFDLPDNWFWCRLGEVCEMYTGNSIAESEKKAKYLGLTDGFSYIGTKDISFDSRVNYDNGVRIPFENNFRRAKKNSVLMCIEGGSAGKKIAVTNQEVCFGNKLCNFNSEEISNRYIYFYLQSSAFKKFFVDNVTGIIGGVSLKRLNLIPFPLPPLDEQKRIAERLKELLPLCETEI